MFECEATEKSAWLSEQQVTERLVSEGWQVRRMKEDGGCCVMTPACGLLPILSEAQEAFFAALDSRTLKDVLAGNRGMKNLIRALEVGRGAA